MVFFNGSPLRSSALLRGVQLGGFLQLLWLLDADKLDPDRTQGVGGEE